MRIDGALPFHVARAYAPAIGGAKPGVAQNSNPLVANRVSAPLDLDRPSVPAPAGSLSLYTRAADRIEAATALFAGRQIDVKA
jgi:hypothetical protein